MDNSTGFKSYVRACADKRFLIIFLLGFTSGFPWTIIGSSMTVWLKENDLTRTTIGFFGSIFAVYSINFLWSPAVDRIKIPWLHHIGQRKSWIIFCQLTIIIAMTRLGLTDPSVSLIVTSLLAFSIALSSATQDIAVDAFRIDLISRQEAKKISVAAAITTAGWWTGFKLPSAAALFLSDLPGMDWSDIFVIMSIFPLVTILLLLKVREPETQRVALQSALDEKHSQTLIDKGVPKQLAHYIGWLYTSVVSPLVEFFSRGKKTAIAILVFVIFFKVGEAFLGKMAKVFYIEIGFTNSEIATYSNLLGWVATVIFSLVGAGINIRFGIIKGLFVSGCAMAASNIMYSVMALVGEPHVGLFAATIVADEFTAAVSTVSFVAFISFLSNRAFTATQYALLASVATFGKTTLSAFSGVAVDSLNGNWALFFLFTALAVIPSLLILLWLGKKLEGSMDYGNDHR